MVITDLFIAEKETDTQRICGSCGELKPVEAFYRDGKYPDGRIRYRRDCRDCYKKTRILERGTKHGKK